MDKNTIIGFVLIGLLLVGFNFLSRPSDEQIAARKHYNDSIEAVNAEQRALDAKQAAALAQNNNVSQQVVDSNSIFAAAYNANEEFVTLNNDVLSVTFSTKGASIYSATLKDYDDQGDENGDNKKPLKLFEGDEDVLNFNFYNQKEIISTKNLNFTPISITDSSVTMRLQADSESYIDFIYTLTNDPSKSYLIDLKIESKGMQDKLAGNNYVDIDWKQNTLRQERGHVFENRLSCLTYRTVDNDTERLSDSKSETVDVKTDVTWIAYRCQFFTTVLISDQKFNDVVMSSTPENNDSKFVKTYSSQFKTFFDPTGKKATQLYVYLGPNKYKTLQALDNGREAKWKLNTLVYLGWPVVKQINRWFTVNIFDWLTGLGMHMGLVLLIMTIIVKIVVFPATKKTYMSSAKMRVLKPYIDEINAKYPNQEDAMKKQQEVMGLYSQYGVSPMGGCLPMLIQFPILMALFMFVPSAIELRQQSFLWATDLSTYDALIKFPFHIPLLGNHLSIFCLLMTVTNILNTKYTMAQQNTGAQPQMPAMKWMMYLMPIMFLFILNDYPSGLCYYYFISTLISVITMIVLRKMTDEDAILAKLEAKKQTKKKSGGGFAARLAQMQEEQQRLKDERLNGKRK